MVHWYVLLLTVILTCGQQQDSSSLPPTTSGANSESTLPPGNYSGTVPIISKCLCLHVLLFSNQLVMVEGELSTFNMSLYKLFNVDVVVIVFSRVSYIEFVLGKWTGVEAMAAWAT